MMSSQPRTLVSLEEYLERERTGGYKSEYYDGAVSAMAAVSPAHVLIETNLIRELSFKLADSPCDVYTSNLRVLIRESVLYAYPDVVVACAPEFSGGSTLLNPKTIVEVVSEATEAYDRGRKFQLYVASGSLQEYVLVSEHTPAVEVWTRGRPGEWVLNEASELDGSVTLHSIPCRLSMRDIYRKVTLEQEWRHG
jgi:Uma2 family endonuclease